MNVLGEKFRDVVVDAAARQEPEEEPVEEEPATATNGAVDLNSHVKPKEPNAQEFARPVEQPPQPQMALPWYEGQREPPGLRRSNEIKRIFASRKPDNSVNRGSSWMKR